MTLRLARGGVELQLPRDSRGSFLFAAGPGQPVYQAWRPPLCHEPNVSD